MLTDPPTSRLRWDPSPFPVAAAEIVAGLGTLLASTDTVGGTNAGLHLYHANRAMRRIFWSADDKLLIVP